MKNLKDLAKVLPRTVELKKNKVKIIDQVFLPDNLKYLNLTKYKQAISAIAEFNVRGAQAIGAVGGAGIYLAAINSKERDISKFVKYINKVGKEIIKARPTASNLAWAVNLLIDKMDKSSVKKAKLSIYRNYKNLLESEVLNNIKIGEHGQKLIKNNSRITTHCNAGSLSSIWYGTASAPIFSAILKNKKLEVLVNETRPWLQGARLTAWEMKQAKIDYTINIDSAIGFLMANKMIDLVIVGADSIALNGDVANKIGTYPLATMAKRHKIPFYVAAVKATIDFEAKTGKDIKIEERCGDEILKHTSYWENRNLAKKQKKEFDPLLEIAPKGAKAFNPVFDVSPKELITAIITEDGIFKPSEIKKLKAK